MTIVDIQPQENLVLRIVAQDGRVGYLDMNPYLQFEAFEELAQQSEFVKVTNSGYFVEWACGADLSADTIEAKWKVVENIALPVAA
jgi:hypothetical protein